MLDLKLRSLTDGKMVSVNIATLALNIRGEVHVPEPHSSPRREQGPGLIVHCKTRRDVIECVEFASRNRLLLTMHNQRSREWDNCNQGIAVDLSTLPTVEGGGSNIDQTHAFSLEVASAQS